MNNVAKILYLWIIFQSDRVVSYRGFIHAKQTQVYKAREKQIEVATKQI